MINVFIPHRWNNNDYSDISDLLDRTKFNVRDYSVPKDDPFDSVDRRYNVDPQIQKQIKYASVVVVKITESTSSDISELNIPVVAKRKDSLENWINQNV